MQHVALLLSYRRVTTVTWVSRGRKDRNKSNLTIRCAGNGGFGVGPSLSSSPQQSFVRPGVVSPTFWCRSHKGFSSNLEPPFQPHPSVRVSEGRKTAVIGPARARSVFSTGNLAGSLRKHRCRTRDTKPTDVSFCAMLNIRVCCFWSHEICKKTTHRSLAPARTSGTSRNHSSPAENHKPETRDSLGAFVFPAPRTPHTQPLPQVYHAHHTSPAGAQGVCSQGTAKFECSRARRQHVIRKGWSHDLFHTALNLSRNP